MNKDTIKSYFDSHAPSWDEEMIRDDAIIKTIFDNAGIKADMSVLDVACGTGVLIDDYLKRGVKSVTGIDISPEMIRIAQSKFAADNVRFICGDVEELSEGQYDCIMIYNAFPHFPQPERLIEKLSAMLKAGGTLTVAHGMSREKIDSHHKGSANEVSIGLMSEDKLAEIFEKFLTVTAKISDERMYQVTGTKR